MKNPINILAIIALAFTMLACGGEKSKSEAGGEDEMTQREKDIAADTYTDKEKLLSDMEAHKEKLVALKERFKAELPNAEDKAAAEKLREDIVKQAEEIANELNRKRSEVEGGQELMDATADIADEIIITMKVRWGITIDRIYENDMTMESNPVQDDFKIAEDGWQETLEEYKQARKAVK